MPVEPRMHVRAQFERAYKRDDSFKKSRDDTLDAVQNAGNLTAKDLDQVVQFRQQVMHGDAPNSESVHLIVCGVLREVNHMVDGTWLYLMAGNGEKEEYRLDHDQQVVIQPNELSVRWAGKP